MCVFLWSWRQRVVLVKEGGMPFPFESYGMALCCPFMTSRRGKNRWLGWLTSLFILFGVTKVDQKIVLLRVLKFKRVDISWPLRFVYLLICFRAKNFQLFSFWVRFSRMFLFYVFSWLVEKFKNVTTMLMRFCSEISWMFLCMFWGLIILRLKNVFSIPCFLGRWTCQLVSDSYRLVWICRRFD